MSHRPSRLASLIVKNITDIIQFEMKNPKIGFITVTRSEVNHDHSLVKIFVSFFDAKDTGTRLEELRNAKGYIRSQLASKMDIYKVPDIAFQLDDTHIKQQQFEETLARAKAKIKK
jgi:ribosome-binding factor A